MPSTEEIGVASVRRFLVQRAKGLECAGVIRPRQAEDERQWRPGRDCLRGEERVPPASAAIRAPPQSTAEGGLRPSKQKRRA